MTVIRCLCGTAIERVKTAAGYRLPFNHELVPVAEAPEGNAWTIRNVGPPGRQQPRAVPYSPKDHRGVRRVLVRHLCEAKQLIPGKPPSLG